MNRKQALKTAVIVPLMKIIIHSTVSHIFHATIIEVYDCNIYHRLHLILKVLFHRLLPL